MLEEGYKASEDKGEEVAWVGEPMMGLMHREVRLIFIDQDNRTNLTGRVYGVVTATGKKYRLVAEKDVAKLRELMNQIKARAETQACASASEQNQHKR